MFTRDIKSLVSIGKSGMKWEAQNPINAPIQDALQLYNLRQLWEKNTGFWNTKERQAFLDALKKATIENTQNKEKMIKDIDALIADASKDGDSKEVQILNGFKKTIEEDYSKLQEKYTTKQKQVALDSMNSRWDLTEKVDKNDNNPRQAEALIKWLQAIKDNTGISALLDAMTKWESVQVGEGWSQMRKLDLWGVNMRGLVDFALSGLDKNKYRSNGSYVFWDSYAVSSFESLYRNNEKSLKPIFQEIQAFYNAGQTTEDWLLARTKIDKPAENYDKSKFVNYLSTYREDTAYEFKKVEWKDGESMKYRLNSVDRSFFTPYMPTEIWGYFANMDDATLVIRVQDIIKIWGWVLSDTPKDPAALFQSMQKDPTLRANYIRGLNFIAMGQNRAEYFRTGKLEIGVDADKATTLIESLKKPENIKFIKEWLIGAATANKAATQLDSNLSDKQKTNILSGIDAAVAKLSDESLSKIAIEWSLALTNKWLAVGAAVGRSLGSTLADSVSLGGSVLTDFHGQLGAAISLALTKWLYQSNKADFWLHYGLVGAAWGIKPFAGIHGAYDDFIASITSSPGMTNLFLGVQVGRNTNTQKDILELSQAQKEIYALTEKKNPADISMKWLVSDPAIAARMDSEIRQLLIRNGYDSLKSQEEIYAVLYSAVIEVMNMEVLRLRREGNDNGTTLKQIGINFGKIGPLTYILPGFRIGRDDLLVWITQAPKKISETYILDGKGAENILRDAWYTLTQQFESNLWKKTFTITPSAEGKPALKVNTSPELAGLTSSWAIQIDTSTNNIVTITTNRNIDLKVEKSATGEITISVVDKSEFTQNNTDNRKTETLTGIDLARDTSFESVMQRPSARKALSSAYVWGNKELTTFLAAYHKADMSDAKTFLTDTTSALEALMKKNGANPDIKAMNKAITSETRDTNKMSMIVRLRTGLMTDMSNTKDMKVASDGVIDFSVSEGVQKNWEKRKSSPELLVLAGALDLQKFDALMSMDARLYRAVSGVVNGIDISKLIGIVAWYKGGVQAHGFSVIPRGMMSIAQAWGRNLIEEMLSTDTAEKSIALKLILKYQPEQWQKMMGNIRSSITAVTKVEVININDIISLLTTGKATFGGKEVTSTAKFYRCAFGECLNTPSYAIDLGTISSGGKISTVEDGSTVSGTEISNRTVNSYQTSIWVNSSNFSVGIGKVVDGTRAPNEPRATTEPGNDGWTPTVPGGLESVSASSNPRATGSLNSGTPATALAGSWSSGVVNTTWSSAPGSRATVVIGIDTPAPAPLPAPPRPNVASPSSVISSASDALLGTPAAVWTTQAAAIVAAK